MQLKDWIELTERYGPAIWQWLRNRLSGFVVDALEKLEELNDLPYADRFTRLNDVCRPQYIKHFENQVTYHLESEWLVYGLPSIEQWLVRAGRRVRKSDRSSRTPDFEVAESSSAKAGPRMGSVGSMIGTPTFKLRK